MILIRVRFILAQMIWYFIDGYTKRKDEITPDIEHCTKYNVSFEDGKNEIIFYKSQKSGRWWMECPFFQKGRQSYKIILLHVLIVIMKSQIR